MPQLDPRLAAWLDGYNQLVEELEASGFEHTPETMREGFARLNENLVTGSPAVKLVTDFDVSDGTDQVPVRLYHPSPNEKLPVLVYLHGGGHMCGSVEVYDPICRQLALATRHVVVSVEYRLAPEFPYPCGLEDAELVINHLAAYLDETNTDCRDGFVLAGDSGGGAMAATLAHSFQHQPGTLKKLVLIYPSLDYDMGHESIESNGQGYLLHRDRIAWYFDHYFQNDEDRLAASPLSMELTTNFPPTLLVTAEFCPLRDEAYAYRERIESVNNQWEHQHYDDLIHAFLNMQDLVPERCEHFFERVAAFLNS